MEGARRSIEDESHLIGGQDPTKIIVPAHLRRYMGYAAVTRALTEATVPIQDETDIDIAARVAQEAADTAG